MIINDGNQRIMQEEQKTIKNREEQLKTQNEIMKNELSLAEGSLVCFDPPDAIQALGRRSEWRGSEMK